MPTATAIRSTTRSIIAARSGGCRAAALRSQPRPPATMKTLSTRIVTPAKIELTSPGPRSRRVPAAQPPAPPAEPLRQLARLVLELRDEPVVVLESAQRLVALDEILDVAGV